MTEHEVHCRALYNAAFEEEPKEFVDALFARYYPEHVRTIERDGTPVSMLFSIPYAVVLENGTLDARYLYGVATSERYRGQGLAKELLQAEAAAHPVFLRPMSPSLFDYYKKVGFSPISPLAFEEGAATVTNGGERMLSFDEFLAMRRTFVEKPYCEPTLDFLSLYEEDGGAIAYGNEAVALFELTNERVWFKEYWGDPVFAPRLAAFLKKDKFLLRRCASDGACFGVGVGVPEDVAFLAALD